MSDDLSIINKVYEIILDRKMHPSKESYVSSILCHEKEMNKVLEKIGEEAIETILAVKNEDKNEIISESSDLIFHLLIMLAANDITPQDIAMELKNRHK